MRVVGPARATMAVVLIGIASGALVSCARVNVSAGSPGIRAVDDPGVVRRGRYLVYGPASCAACHGDPARDAERRQGREIPLSGGRAFHLGPLGTIVAPNLTSDAVAGIGALADDTLVRSLRYGISRQGKPLVPVMPFADLADEDLQAILSFLRTLPAVGQPAPPSKVTWLGVFVLNAVLGPPGPTASPPSRLTPARSAEYGRYLAHTVAHCHGCHTRRSPLTGALVGPAFAGGSPMKEPAGTFVPPDLMGISSGLTEQEFIARFRIDGRGQLGSPMPWEAFARMTDDDLGAIYRYLKTLPPVKTRRPPSISAAPPHHAHDTPPSSAVPRPA